MDEGADGSLDGRIVDGSEDGRSEARVEVEQRRCLLAKTEKRKAKRSNLFASYHTAVAGRLTWRR
jgi:hypothetical protein